MNTLVQNNKMSLTKIVMKHQKRLHGVELGSALFDAVKNDPTLRRYADEYNIKFVRDMTLDNEFYTMVFEDQPARVSDFNYEIKHGGAEVAFKPKADEFKKLATKAVRIVETPSTKPRQELRKYIGLRGTVLLDLANQNQYVVEFPEYGVVAIPAVNVKEVEMDLVTSISLKEAYSNGGEYNSIMLATDAKPHEIEEYLRQQNGKIDAIVVTKKYFLAELD